jgi:hypothetical protein
MKRVTAKILFWGLVLVLLWLFFGLLLWGAGAPSYSAALAFTFVVMAGLAVAVTLFTLTVRGIIKLYEWIDNLD